MKTLNIVYILATTCFLICVHGLRINNSTLLQTQYTNANINVTEFQNQSYNSSIEISGSGTDEENFEFEYSKDEFESNSTDTSRVLKGTAAVASQFPFAVHIKSMTPTGVRVCTGALLTSEFVLTAASCIYDATSISVTAATLDLSETASNTVLVVRAGVAIVHPKYESNTHNHDIALVRLITPYMLGSSINIINLAHKLNTLDTSHLAGKSMRILGYGFESKAGTVALRYTYMRVLSSLRCTREMRRRNIRPSIFQDCLDTETATLGMCSQEDKGGPVTYKFDSDSAYTLVGVMNYYYECESNTPNLFTRIGPYMDLIRRYVPYYDNSG